MPMVFVPVVRRYLQEILGTVTYAISVFWSKGLLFIESPVKLKAYSSMLIEGSSVLV